MTREEIMKLDAEGIEKRLAEIEAEKADEKANLEELTREVRELAERKKALALEIEQRKADAVKVAAGEGTIIAKVEGKKAPDLKEVRSSEAYVNAYAEFIKTNDDTEVRALLTDLVTDGTVPVPTLIDDRIATAWERSNLISRIRRTSIKGTAKYPFEFSATGASVHTEGTDAPTEEQLVLGTVTIEPQMLKKWITLSDEVMALKGQAFLDYIYDEIEFRILLLADSQVVSAIKAAPAAATKTAAGVRALTPSAIDATTIFAALAELAPGAVNPVAIMHKQTYFNQFMGLLDTTKRPIYDIVSANGRPTYYINGVEVLFDNTLATGANAEIIVGDLDGAIINLPDGREVSFVTDPYSLAEKDLIKIVGKMYCGIGIVRDGYFVKVTVS